jgi:hypothetical protein
LVLSISPNYNYNKFHHEIVDTPSNSGSILINTLLINLEQNLGCSYKLLKNLYTDF